MKQESCNKIYYCYKVTNQVNGKVYIGFAGDPEQRWREHKRDANTGRGFALSAAIRKYGLDSFEFEVICCGLNRREMLEYVEPGLIKQYQSRIDQNGYNVTRGGGEHIPVGNRGGSKKGRIVSKESRLRMSAAKKGNVCGAGNKGKKRSEETKQKMSAALMGHSVSEEARRKIGEGNRRPRTEEEKQYLSKINTGKKLSDETKRKIAIAGMGRKVSGETRRKISEAKRGHIVTKETRRKISATKMIKTCGNT